MLLHFELFFNENDTNKKQVDGKCYLWMLFDLLPCSFHFGAPMNIVENQESVIMSKSQQLLEIMKCGFLFVMTIYESEVDDRL